MKMRMPSIPLVTVDPYFSVWSRDEINKMVPTHWTGSGNAMLGTVTVDGTVFRFLGKSDDPVIQQTSVDIDAFSTTVVFANSQIELTAKFTTPILLTELYYASRPVSYLKLSYRSLDGKEHRVSAKLSVSEELVLNKAGEGRACSNAVLLQTGTAVRMGSGAQKVLWRSGDNIRIDWGYFYLAVKGAAEVGNEVFSDLYAVYASAELQNEALFVLAYDDIDSMIYFEKPLKAYWKKDGKTITEAIDEAISEYDALCAKCTAFSKELKQEAMEKGGEQYAELLLLAYRQVMAAHKLVVDEDGNNLYISKECFSNGCAATVDVTYPSAPMYLRYNPELLKGMLRPIIRYAHSDAWKQDFAPHDVGRYPLVNGQAYASAERLDGQMPVEECGNMLILIAAICDADQSADFAADCVDLLEQWSRYLIEYGEDPGNQLCTDDFAGHLAHNCNLALKAIMGIMGYSRILARLGQTEKVEENEKIARRYAASFLARARNDDGSYRLAFDRPDTFSMKYNAVWDKLWNTGLFPDSFYEGELARYRREAMPYGVPLDNRKPYTKSDWTLWVACFAEEKEDFEFFTNLLWKAYHTMRSRVPMTDWFYVDTSEICGFIHRSVQGGLFLKLLFA